MSSSPRTRNGQVREPVAKAKPTAPTNSIGVSGLAFFSGRLREEFLPQLQGTRFYRVMREMSENDGIISALLLTIDMLMRQVEWRVEPADTEDPGDENKAQMYADHVASCIDDMSFSWEDTISGILSFLVYGWSYAEIIYKKRVGPDEVDPRKRSKHTDNLIGWRKIETRAQETKYEWILDDDGGVQGLRQQDPNTFDIYPIPIERALLFRTTIGRNNNPEGKSILRGAYRSWFYKKRIEEIEGIGIERDLAGLPVVYAPQRIFDENRTDNDTGIYNALLDLVTRIRRDEQEGVLMPQAYDESGHPLYELKLLNSGGRRQFDTSAIIGRYSLVELMTALADFLMLGHEQVGSKALSLSKIGVFQTALEAWNDMLAGIMNTHAVPRLIRLNGWDVALSPRLIHGNIQEIDVATLVTAILQLAQAGAPLWNGAPDDPNLMYIKERLGLPLEIEDAVLEDYTTGVQTAQPAQAGQAPIAQAPVTQPGQTGVEPALTPGTAKPTQPPPPGQPQPTMVPTGDPKRPRAKPMAPARTRSTRTTPRPAGESARQRRPKPPRSA